MSLWPSPWPAEDGGSARGQTPLDLPGLGVAANQRLEVVSRDALASTMFVLRDPGELFLLRHTLGPRGPDDPVETWVERLDPVTLAPLASSRRLAAGPFWPGGLLAHANGSLYVTAGRWCHRLASDLSVLSSRELPQLRPYNSLVALASGVLVMKDLDRSAATNATLTVLDPETLDRLAPDRAAPEPSIARLSALGDTLYVVGAHTISRWNWDGRELMRDQGWELRYRTRPGQGYGWDAALAGGHAWFMDNGEHDYVTTMLGAGVASGPVHLVRVSLADPADHELVPVCGAPAGAITNPPLFDPQRRLAVAYDSANGVLAAFGSTPGGSRRSGGATSRRPDICCCSATQASWWHTTSIRCRARARAWRAPPGQGERGCCRANASGVRPRGLPVRTCSCSTSKPAPSAGAPKCPACSSRCCSRAPVGAATSTTARSRRSPGSPSSPRGC